MDKCSPTMMNNKENDDFRLFLKSWKTSRIVFFFEFETLRNWEILDSNQQWTFVYLRKIASIRYRYTIFNWLAQLKLSNSKFGPRTPRSNKKSHFSNLALKSSKKYLQIWDSYWISLLNVVFVSQYKKKWICMNLSGCKTIVLHTLI